MTIEASAFETGKRSDLIIDTDAALKPDAILTIVDRSEQLNVEANGAAVEAQVDTVAAREDLVAMVSRAELGLVQNRQTFGGFHGRQVG